MNPTPPPIPGNSPRRPNQAARVIFFLLLGLAPTPIALIFISTPGSKRIDDKAAVFLLVVDVVLSFAAAFGIMSTFSVKGFVRGLLAFVLGLSLCALNAVVSVFTGCLLLVGK